MAFKNHLSLVGYIAAHAALSAKYKDLDGNVKELLPAGSGNALDLDQFRKDLFPSSTDGHPDVGADVYPGSYAKGEITGRYLINDTKTDPTKVTNLIFNRDVGSQLNMVGDGLEFHGYLLKTTVTNGVKGATVKVPIYYDPKNVAKPGYYVTTTPYPMHVKGTSFAVDNTIQIPLDGVGEGNTGKNHSAPAIRFTFKANKSMDVRTVQGYDNDGASDGVTGFTYDYVNELVSIYSKQPSVPPLPKDIYVFQGTSYSDMSLNGVSEYYGNVPNGLKFNLDGYLYFNFDGKGKPLSTDSGRLQRISLSDLGGPSSFTISKENLIIGNQVPFVFDNSDLKFNQNIQLYSWEGSDGWEKPNGQSLNFMKVLSITNGEKIKINSNSVTIPAAFEMSTGSSYSEDGFLKIISIQSY